MRRIEENKRLEDDHLQGKGKAPVTSQYRNEYHPDRIQRGLRGSRGPRWRTRADVLKELIWLLKSLFTRSLNELKMSLTSVAG